MNVPFIDLKKQFFTIQKEVEEAIWKVLRKGQFILGENVSLFEQEVCEYLDTEEAVSVGSGSDALYLSLRAYNIGPGDEVITTPFSFVATSDAILRAGATPVFADIDNDTYNIDPEKIKERITPQTKAIMPVHLYGQCAEMDQIMDLAKRHSLIVIEDACQAFGAEYMGRKAGTWGNTGCFSFFPTKNLGGLGDGGMVVTHDKEVAKRLRMLRVHGRESRYEHVLTGINSRLDEIQAAVLRVKLHNIDYWNKRRREIAKEYDLLLQGLPLTMPHTNQFAYHVYHLFVIETLEKSEREKLISFLWECGIETAVHYPKPIYLQPSYQKKGYKKGICPNAERACDRVCAIPLYPEMTDEEVRKVAAEIIAFYKGGKDGDS